MDRRKITAHVVAGVAVAALACASGAAQPAAGPQQGASAPTPGSTMGYGVRLGGFFNDKHKEAAKRSFAQYFAKNKTCPKDMERQGKTCHALVQGHYWAVGQPVQSAVETFPLPDEVTARLPAPPAGYEYVRAGEDVLLVSSKIHLVVDMMQDVAG